MKTCNKCHFPKPISEFSKRKESPDGLQYCCKECNRKRCNKWSWGHRNHIKDYQKQSKFHNWRNEYLKNRRETDVEFKLSQNLRRRLNHILRGNVKCGSAVGDLGCTIDEFKRYIEGKFGGGMSWDNYGEWHLDHIIPLSKFKLEDRQQLLIACNYTNYQPLWGKDNMSKSNSTVLDFRGGFF